MADSFSALRTSPQNGPSLFDQITTAPQIDPVTHYELTSGSEGQLAKGLRLGAAGLTSGSFANQALRQEVANNPEWQRSRDLAMQTQAEAAPYALRVNSLRDVHSLGDAADYAAGAFGQGAMSMAPTLATALLTRGRGTLGKLTSFAGATIPAYEMERGEAAMNQYADPTLSQASAHDRDVAASAKGAINAGLESIVPAGLANSFLRKPAGSLLGHIGREALTEGTTEAIQQGVGFGAEKYLDPNRKLDPMDIADAFASGALTGGGMTGLTHAPSHLAEMMPEMPQKGVKEQPKALPGPQPNADGSIDLGQPVPSGSVLGGLGEKLGPQVQEFSQRTKDFVTDTANRMSEAAKTAMSPTEFFQTVFNSPADTAAMDLSPDSEDPSVLNAADPEAAIVQRDAEKQQRAAQYAESLLNNPNTPDATKEQITAMQGDYSNPESQGFVARTFLMQNTSEKVKSAVSNIVDVAKQFGSQIQDKIVKKNLQDTTPAEQAAFNKVVFDGLTDEAKANPEIKQRLPELANSMLAFAARTGDLTKNDLKTLSKIQDGLSLFANPEETAKKLTEYAGLPRTEDSFLSRIKQVTNAQQDISQPNSFLYSSLTEEAKDSLRPSQLKQLARLVDDFSLTDSNNKQAEKVLAGLTQAFGSRENAQAVLDYYQQQNRADVRFDPNEQLTQGGTTEREAAPAASYQFADAKALRPYRAFAGRVLNETGSRQRLKESTLAGLDLRRNSPDNTRVRPIKMSQYVAETGKDANAEVKRLESDIQSRIDQHQKRKGEDRSQQIRELQGELSMLQQAHKDGGAKAALDLYEVLHVSGQEQNDTVATDADIAKMSTLAEAQDAKGTRVTFERQDGTKFTLSAESMWKTLGDKEGSGKGENAKNRAKRLFADAVASVLARPEVARLATPMEKIQIDRKMQLAAKKKPNPEYRAMVAKALKDAEGGLKNLRTTLDNVVEEYSESADNEDRREEIESILEQNIQQLSKKLEEARAGNGPLAGNSPAQAVAREKLQMYRDTQQHINGVKFEEEFDNRYDEVKDDGPLGKNQLNRTRMNEELSNPNTRYYEEDTGLGVGVEKRGSKPQTNSDAAIDALHDVAVNGNTKRLDTPDKVLRYIAMAKAAVEQLSQIAPDSMTQNQRELLNSLEKNPKFDGLMEGMRRTNEQQRLFEELTSKQSAMGAKPGRVGNIDQQKILDEIRRVRGDKVKVLFQKFSEIGGSGEFSMNKDKTERLIKIATNAANPMGAAWHESLHDFFAMLDENPVHRRIKKDLVDAADAPQVKNKLRELLASHPKALEQIENSAEERVAYMYQFWAEGALTVGPKSSGILNRVRQFFRDMLHLVSTDSRAEALLTALHEGKFAEPSTVSEVLEDMRGDRFSNTMEKLAPAVTQALGKVFKTAPDRLRAYQNETISQLADMFSSERGQLGFIQKRFQQQGIWENKLAGVLKGTTSVERRAALENLQAMKTPVSKLETELVKFFGDMHDYLENSGVKSFNSEEKKWVPLRQVKDYFPRTFDRQAIEKDRAGFQALLEQHGKMSTKDANAIIDALVNGPGQLDLADNEHALGYTPFMKAVNNRQLTFIDASNAADFAKYQVKDLADITTGYVKQAVHRAEYAKLFDNDGSRIEEMIKDSGIKNEEEKKDIQKVIKGLEGSLNNNLSPATKEIMSGVMTLQNLVILPLALFSQMVDPIVLASRSGDLRDAGNAFITAVKRAMGKEVPGEELADMLGIISRDTVLEAMGNAYGTVFMSKRMRDINRVFFKYNGMQGWNDSMRIAATAAGEKYLIANKDNAKALSELGLTSSDIDVGTDGRLNVSSPQVQQAMFRFVDQAVLRPSASNRPVWMSDPRFLLVSHLKQFTYAMHNVVIKRANRELADGNPKPWGILMLTMPMMLAADMAKFVTTGGVPPGWGFKDYLVHAVERSGLLGLGDFGVQAMRGVETGKLPGESLLGPTAENLAEILRWIGGDPSTKFTDVVDRTLPGARFI